MSRVDEAVSRFSEGFSCSQAVCSVFAGDYGLTDEQALKVASGFGGGMGQTGGTCGVVSGAVIVLGLAYGATSPDEKEAKAKTYALVQEFVAEFSRRHGAVDCPALLGCDLATPEGRERARQEGLTRKVCPAYVRSAAEILEQML
ncbi:C-GCAxxG-C-C family protein [Methanoculleus frigidifontis]|nr:C-GCAxxG-C-C family protein [Methanoculleus sp. FWC-SCC1]